MPLFTYSYDNRQYRFRCPRGPDVEGGCTEYIEQWLGDPPRKYAVHWRDNSSITLTEHALMWHWRNSAGRLTDSDEGFTAVLVQE